MSVNIPTLAELTAAHPEWRKAENLPDILSVAQVAVWTQRHLQTVRLAAKTGRLRATQFDKFGSYRIAKTDAQRWADGLAPVPARHLRRA